MTEFSNGWRCKGSHSEHTVTCHGRLVCFYDQEKKASLILCDLKKTCIKQYSVLIVHSAADILQLVCDLVLLTLNIYTPKSPTVIVTPHLQLRLDLQAFHFTPGHQPQHPSTTKHQLKENLQQCDSSELCNAFGAFQNRQRASHFLSGDGAFYRHKAAVEKNCTVSHTHTRETPEYGVIFKAKMV